MLQTVSAIAFLTIFLPLVFGTAQGAAITNDAAGDPIQLDSGPQGENTTLRTGIIFNLSLSNATPTDKWAGLIGNATGRIQLRNSGNKSFFDWTVTSARNDSTKGIYPLVVATNGSTAPKWGLIIGLRTGANLDTFLGINSTDNDSATEIFNARPNVSSNLILGNQSVSLVQNTAAPTDYYWNGAFIKNDPNGFSTFSINDGTPNAIFATWLLPINQSRHAFDNFTQVQYQLLLYSKNTTPYTYKLYAELR